MKNYLTKIVLLLCVFGSPALAQVDLSQPLPFDPAVRCDTLSNGLTYYVRRSTNPEKRAELRLVVKVGSLVENDDQRGLAHFLGHMIFNGTKHFPRREITDFMKRLGMGIEPDVNVTTSFDQTVYQLSIPTDSVGVLEKSLRILEDWAHSALLESQEIEKERGAVIEEAREAFGVGGQIRRHCQKLIFGESRFAERPTTGKEETLKNFRPETLRQFYADWYRPDLMAVIAVGDFDEVQVERLVKRIFSRVPKPQNPLKLPEYTIPLGGGTDIAIISTDPEEHPTCTIRLVYKMPKLKGGGAYDLRNSLLIGYSNSMLSDRVWEESRRPGTPLSSYASYYHELWHRLAAFSSMTTVNNSADVERALAVILAENARLKKFGFTEAEWEPIRKTMIEAVQHTLKSTVELSTRNLVGQYFDHFLHGKTPMSLEYSLRLTLKLLENMQLAEFNELARQAITKQNLVVLITGPVQAREYLPTEVRVREMLAAAEN